MQKNVDELSESDKVKLLEKYLNKVKSKNRAATLKNIGACIGLLGIVMPTILVAWRFMDKDNKAYQVRTDIENKLKAELANI